MLGLIVILVMSFVITYKAFGVVTYISKKDEVLIKINTMNKVILSLVASLDIALLYIKHQSVISIIPVFIALTFITIIAYIDFYTKYIYSIVSKPLLIVSVLMFISNIANKNVSTKVIILLVGIAVIFYIFGKLRYIGEGDVEVIIALLLLFSKDLYLIIMIIFFAFGISGVVGIYLLIFKKVELNHSKPFIPSLALAMYLTLFLY